MGLLKGLDPLLTADLLYTLRSMGHGDTLCVCDCNFPAAEVASKTTSKAHIVLTSDLPSALNAIMSVRGRARTRNVARVPGTWARRR